MWILWLSICKAPNRSGFSTWRAGLAATRRLFAAGAITWWARIFPWHCWRPPHDNPRSAPVICAALPFKDASFDWILNFFTSFGYFERERENFRVLEELTRLLRPQGRFMIDFLNKDRVLATLKEREIQEKAGRTIHIERWYDDATRRINKRMRLEQPDGRSATYLESVRAYDRDEVTIGARWAGLEVDALYGNFNGEPYHRESERLILIGHKPL